MKTDNEIQTAKLIEGKIPIGCVCPFKDKCVIKDVCEHKGESHGKPFSCAFARAYEIEGEDKK